MNPMEKPGLVEARKRSRRFVGLLLIASLTIVTLDAKHGPSGSPVDPLRNAVGTVLGPVESTAAAAFRPLTNVPDYFADVADLRADNTRLAQSNAELQRQLTAAQANQHRDAEVTGIGAFSDSSG